ncbi:MAG: hypothetical protein NXI00_06045 [Cytophagales bacterium]|nr:hypothetical protein [Cytophagales bacterium]
MKPFQFITRFFQRERSSVEKPYFDFDSDLSYEESSSSVAIQSEPAMNEQEDTAMVNDLVNIPMKSEPELPQWMRDEEALRDEGVIFGLSEASAEDKIQVISSVFSERAADSEKRVELLSEQIGEFNLKISQLEKKIEENQNKQETFEKADWQPHQLPRTSISLLLSVIMACGNVFLIDHVLAYSFPETHIFVTIGVFFAGMFSLFSGRSFLQHSDEVVDIRRIFQEVLLPFASSLFVFLHALSSLPTRQAIGLFFFTFSLFLYSGKLFLENVSLIKRDIDAWGANQKLKRNLDKRIPELEETIADLHLKIDEIRVEKWKIIPELNKAESKVVELANQKQAMIHLFESEFKLARSYRDKLTRTQIKNIVD